MMNENGLKLQQAQEEAPPSFEEMKSPDSQPTDEKPKSLKEDPDYQRIKDELHEQWLKRTGVESFSGNHQDYLFGNPVNRNASTLEQDAERAFRKQYPERATEYDENERTRAYEKIDEDPAYKKMQEKITVRTNTDSQVRSASRSGREWSGTQDRVRMREHIHAMNDFARTYPEKAEAYAERWYAFEEKHPEIANMNNVEWQTWCNDHPGAFTSMSGYRNVSRAVEHIYRRAEIDRVQPQVQASETRLSKIRAELGVEDNGSNSVEATPLSQEKERLNQLQLEDVASTIRTSVPAEIQSADTEALQAMQKELAELPYVPGENIREILDYKGENEGVMMVDTDAIVGSVSPAFADWSTEYDNRKGRIVDIAQELMKGTPEAVDHVFHVTDPEHGVKLKKISAPGGDLFFVIDGSHRVAGSKLARLPELPAQVENMAELSEVRTTDSKLKTQWEQRIKRGLIQGSVEESTTSSGQKSFNLKIDSQILPWMSLPEHKLIEMTKLYFDRYPNALEDIKSFKTDKKIPKEALLDEVALNFYLTDRWDEYRPKK